MGEIINSYIFPHPPIIIPEIGRGRESGATNTIDGVIKASKEIAKDAPTTIILTTPHAPMFKDYIYMSIDDNLEGDLGSFGRPDIKMDFENNLNLVKEIIKKSKEENILAGGISNTLINKYNIEKKLDHGALVPLYYIKKRYDNFKLVHIAISGISHGDLYRFGKCIKDAVSRSIERVVFVASGDLSHRLTKDAPGGFNKNGKIFDEKFVELVNLNDVPGILNMDPTLCENAGECGLKSFIIMYGSMDGEDIRPEVYSYEGPFGVGYAVAKISSMGPSVNDDILEEYTQREADDLQKIRKGEDELTRLARLTLEGYVKEGIIIDIPPETTVNLLIKKAGVFVSIKKQGHLRGCIGTILPTTRNIASEIIQNAISAGTQDPRFETVIEEELESLNYSVDVLGKPENIKSKDELDVSKYGVIVIMGSKRGLLLPNLEGVDTVKQQVKIALQKAGIDRKDNFKMQRFEVTRHV